MYDNVEDYVSYSVSIVNTNVFTHSFQLEYSIYKINVANTFKLTNKCKFKFEFSINPAKI